MAKPSPVERAKAALDRIITDVPAWSAALSLLNSRAVRDHLVLRRLEKGLTQKQVAEAMGVKQPTVSEFETARYPDPYISTLARYARAVGVELDISAVPSQPLPDADTLNDKGETSTKQP